MARQSSVGRAELVVDSVSAVLWLWIDKKALISPTFLETKNEMRVHIQFAHTCNIFRVRGGYRAHALSAVAKSLLTQLDMDRVGVSSLFRSPATLYHNNSVAVAPVCNVRILTVDPRLPRLVL